MTDYTLTVTARCLAVDCGWFPTGETWLEIDREAEKHVKAAGHATVCAATRYPVKREAVAS